MSPILLSDASPGLGGMSTRVSLFLEASERGTSVFQSSLGDVLSAIAPSLDCDIEVVDCDGELHRVHSRSWYEEDAVVWLQRACPSGAPSRRKVEKGLESDARGLVVIRDSEGRAIGRASLQVGRRGRWEGRVVDRGLLVDRYLGGHSRRRPHGEYHGPTAALMSGLFFGAGWH